jgi:DNA-binding CsgD family transcriptional regulator
MIPSSVRGRAGLCSLAAIVSTEGSELLERETELARIEAGIERALDAEGEMLLVEGPAGIGKTALLRAARGLAGERMTALSARATELEREFPFGAVRQLLEPPLRGRSTTRRSKLLEGVAAHAAPALGLDSGGFAGADPGFATLNGLYWLVCDLAAERPLLLLIDDAHWADRDSLRFLTFLAPRLSELPVLLVLAARSEAWRSGSAFAATASDPAARALAPTPLSAEATATLVATGLEAEVHPEFASACHTATGGNPFYLRALLDELRRDRVAPSEWAAEQVMGLGPRAVAQAIVARLALLPPAAPQLARAVAVLGDDADPAQAARLAALEPAEASEAGEELTSAAILETGGRLRFAHPIIRNAVYEDIGRRERTELHRRAVELLAEHDAAAERVPSHLLVVDPAADVRVVETMRAAAAGALQRGAADSAVAYLRRALAEPPPESQRADVLLELGWAEAQVLDPAAIAHLEAAEGTAGDPLRRGAVLGALSFARYLQGDRAGAAATAREAFEQIPPGAGGEPEAQLLLSYCLPGRAVPGLVDEVVALLERPRSGPGGEPTAAEVVRLALAGLDAFLRGERRLAIERLHTAAEQLAGLPEDQSLPSAAVGTIQSLLLAEGDSAAPILERAIAQARRRGSRLHLGLALQGRTNLRWMSGDLAGAIADAETVLRLSAELGGGEWDPVTVVIRVLRAICLSERGDLSTATSALQLPEGVEARLPGIWGWTLLPYGRARVALARDDWVDARELALEAGERLLSVQAPSPEYLPWRSLAAQADARLGERERALALAREELELARQISSPRATGIALSALGGIEGGDDGLDALRDAVEELSNTPARLEHARALVDLGAAIRRAGSRADARKPLREGMALARECGALSLAERAYTELRAAGARPRKPADVGADALTPSELRVARLAADGMTNREIAQRLFVTVKTVEFHLGQTYRKLEISSRAELGQVL